MRTAIIFAFLALVVCATAEQTQFRNKLTSLLNMQAKAADAIDSALQLLRDLKQANVDAQAEADEVNRTQEQSLGKQIADLLFIADQNKASGNAATTYRKHIESEISGTQEYLTWINNRRDEIIRKRRELIDQRCYSSLMFVKSLKETDEAIQVIKWLREDVLGVISADADEADFSQIKDSASKLAAYAHLFNDAAMKQFSQLTQADWDARADDNDKGQLGFDTMTSGTAGRDVGNKLLQAIEELEQHLVDSMAELKKNEIKAAWDLVAWLNDSEKELDHLDDE